MKIIDRVRRRAGERGGTPAAMTFDPHPPRVRPARQGAAAADDDGAAARGAGARRHAGRRGRPLHARDVALGSRDVRAHGARRVAARRRGLGRRELPVRPRARRHLHRCCAALGARYGFRAEKIDPVRYKDFVVSSTRIRRLVAEGRVDEAGALLGHHYFIDGTVVRGAGRGREIGFPTANLATPQRAAAAGRRLRDDGRRSTGSCIPSVTNIGMRPTFGDVGRR